MNRNYCVYRHTAPNGKVYIGITGTKPEKRWQNGNGYKHNRHFMYAIMKYGWDNFTHEILFTGLTQAEAFEKEVELIRQHKSNNGRYGYNIENGGESGKQLAEETKAKIRKSLTGKFTEAQWAAVKTRKKANYHHSEEIKKLIGDSHRGKPLSAEHRKKLSEAHKGIKPKNIAELRKFSMRPILQYDKEGNLVARHESIRDAAILLNTVETNIGQCCRGITKTAVGYIWRYADDKGGAV